MRVKQSKVPVSIRRIAAQHLESLRGTELGYNVDDLYLGEDVCPIYRPDIRGAAYYEFEVLKETRKNPDNRTDLVPDVAKTNILGIDGRLKIYRDSTFPIELAENFAERLQSQVQGFITVSATENDFPVPHWSLDHLPISHYLENDSKRYNKKIERIYKLDALAYLGEDERGDEVAILGQKPSLIRNIPSNLAVYAGRINSTVPKTQIASRDPDLPRMIKRAKLKRGPKVPNLTYARFTSWKSMKEDYAQSYKPMLEVLKIKAEKCWKIEQSMRDFGEGIKVGEPFYIPLLEKSFAVEVKGEGSGLVKVRIVKRPNGNAAVELICENQTISKETDLVLHIKYDNNSEEQLNFFIYKPDLPTNEESVIEED